MADRESPLRRTLEAGVAFCLAGGGLLLAFEFLPGSEGSGSAPLYALVALGTGGVGTLCWLAFVERLDRWSTRRRGALAGAATGLLGPSGFVLLASLFGETLGGVGNPVERLGAALFVGTVSLLYVGWFSVPVGTATGYLLGCRESPDETAEAA
ncbi:hypothetical protein [Halosimplex salinum]|uniref:hypothetical protein n=1 Tax=Halosimplex salinum TaxID=1710538 RepID=UPI000F46776B|nr:hypothetical protein [Halosimplex salinum]